MKTLPPDFDTRGWALIPSLLNERDCAVLRDKIHAINTSYDTSVGTDKLKARMNLMLAARPGAAIVSKLAWHPVTRRIFATLYKRPVVEHTKVLVKAAGAPETPWHQDAGFWADFDPTGSMFTIWVALEDIGPEKGALRILDIGRGKSAQHFPHKPVHGNQEREIEDDALTHLMTDTPVVDCAMRAGDALIFQSWVVHSAYSNTTGTERLACKVVFQDLAARPRSRPLSPRSVSLTGFSGFLNKWNACMVTRWNIRIRELLTRLHPLTL